MSFRRFIDCFYCITLLVMNTGLHFDSRHATAHVTTDALFYR